jgi:hypothetical protein
LFFIGINEVVLDAKACGQYLVKGAVMLVTSSDHLFDELIMPAIQGSKLSSPPIRLRMVGISLLIFC